jgi:hypothetical protein
LNLESNPSLARRMGEKGRTALLTTHEQRLCCNHWSDLIGDLLAQPGTTRRRPTALLQAKHTNHGAAAPFLTALL